jgi:energy-coupling factor transporter ATP-binding protein EcfA2
VSFALEPGQRGVCIGQTGCGKSTLSTELVRRYLAEYPLSRVLIVDSKPRYRATHKMNGWSQHYPRWAKGDTIYGSIAVHKADSVMSAFRFSRCVILQSLYPNAREVSEFEEEAFEASRKLFRSSHESSPTLLYVDEYYDLITGGGLSGHTDRRVLQVIRAGRERYMSALISTQRPRSIPLPTLTEATKYYIFTLEYIDDIEYMRKHGPKLIHTPHGYNFVFYERLNGGQRIEKVMRLGLNEDSRVA